MAFPLGLLCVTPTEGVTVSSSTANVRLVIRDDQGLPLHAGWSLAPCGPASASLARGCCRTSLRWVAGNHTPQAFPAGRKSGSAGLRPGGGRARLQVCREAGQAWAMRSRARCSRPRSRVGSPCRALWRGWRRMGPLFECWRDDSVAFNLTRPRDRPSHPWRHQGFDGARATRALRPTAVSDPGKMEGCSKMWQPDRWRWCRRWPVRRACCIPKSLM